MATLGFGLINSHSVRFRCPLRSNPAQGETSWSGELSITRVRFTMTFKGNSLVMQPSTSIMWLEAYDLFVLYDLFVDVYANLRFICRFLGYFLFQYLLSLTQQNEIQTKRFEGKNLKRSIYLQEVKYNQKHLSKERLSRSIIIFKFLESSVIEE